MATSMLSFNSNPVVDFPSPPVSWPGHAEAPATVATAELPIFWA